MKRIGQLFLVVIFAFAAFGSLHFTRLKRIFTYPFETEITDSEWYSPMSVVEGNPDGWIELSDSSSIPESVLVDLAEYAGERNSNAFLVMHRGELLIEKYWNGANRESTTNSMSMVKTIIGILIGSAIDDGLISSEKDPASKYLTEWQDDERSKITIEDLLYMQSGLLNDDNSKDLFSDVVDLYMGPNAEKTALKIPHELEPKSQYDYNNANTQLLGIILERVSGKSIEAYASEKLWKPIGAHDAEWWLDRQDGMPKTFCCYFATAQDWLRLGQLFIQNGSWNGKTIISESWIEKMTTQSELERDYGLHIWLMYQDGGRRAKHRTEPYREKTFGIDGKEKQHVYIVPSLDLVIVRLGNTPPNWDESIFVNTIDKALEAIE